MSRASIADCFLLACWLDQQRHPELSGDGFAQDRLLDNGDAWSAGHSVSGIHAVSGVAELVDTLAREYRDARATTRKLPSAGT